MLQVGSQLLIILCGLVGSILMARGLGPSGRGVVAFLIVFGLIVVRLASVGLETGNIYFSARQPAMVGHIVGNSLMVCFVVTVIVGTLTLIASHIGVISAILSARGVNGTFLAITLASVPLQLLVLFFAAILQGRELFGSTAIASVIPGLLQVLLLSTFVATGKLSVASALWSVVLSSGAGAVLSFWLLRKEMMDPIGLNCSVFRSMIDYSTMTYFSALASFLLYRLDQLILGALKSPHVLGIYVVSVALSDSLFVVPNAIATVLLPMTARRSEPAFATLATDVARWQLGLSALFALGIGVMAEPLVTVIYSQAFAGAVLPLRLRLIGVVGLSYSKILGSSMLGRGDARTPLRASLYALATTVFLDAALIPKWGAVGAALASGVGYAAAAVVLTRSYIKCTATPYSTLFAFGRKDLHALRRFFAYVRTLRS